MADGVSEGHRGGREAFHSLATFVLMVAVLSIGRPVLLPIGLAIILSFVLTPLVRGLELIKLPRGLAVGLSLAVALAVLGGFGFILNHQVQELSTQLARYSSSMKRKVASLRNEGPGAIDSIQKTVDTVTKELDEKVGDLKAATAVKIVPEDKNALERFKETLEPIFEPLAAALIVLVLAAFLLGQREDVRDRLIRLAGNVSLSTRTMDEAVQRISRYLLLQLVINLVFGSIVALGLHLIGVPYAVLWGVITAALRFVPYIGSILAMSMPLLLAFAKFPGWTETLQTVALFLVLDSITAYFIEPWLIGHRTGVSALALLISTLFWTWLWGPVGLVLSTPFTVAVTVLGRHVRQLHFLSVLLGDEPALELGVSFYQRLLARDEDEATLIVEKLGKEADPVVVMDRLLAPALAMAARDRAREEIQDSDAAFVLRAVSDLALQLGPGLGAPFPTAPRANVLLIASRSQADQVLAELLGAALRQQAIEATILPAASSSAELLESVRSRSPRAVCIAAVPPQGGSHAAYLCRLLKAELPGVKRVVLRPHLDAGQEGAGRLLLEAGADQVVPDLLLAASALRALLVDVPSTR